MRRWSSQILAKTGLPASEVTSDEGPYGQGEARPNDGSREVHPVVPQPGPAAHTFGCRTAGVLRVPLGLAAQVRQ